MGAARRNELHQEYEEFPFFSLSRFRLSISRVKGDTNRNECMRPVAQR